MWSEPNNPRVFVALIGASITAHIIGVAVMPTADAAHEGPREPTTIAITFTQPPPPPPPPVHELRTEPPSTTAARTTTPTTRRVAARPRAQNVARPLPTTAAAPTAPTEADFTMTTMTNSGESSFATAAPQDAGNGGQQTGRQPATSGANGNGTQIVTLANLSRAPIAPALDAPLERNYPSAARDAGRSGTAVVRVRIASDGRAEVLRILSATGADFGEACRRTLRGSVWQPPLDGNGAAVSTEISYTCRFEIAH